MTGYQNRGNPLQVSFTATGTSDVIVVGSPLAISIAYGGGAGTVVIQRRRAGTTDSWKDVKSYTADAEEVLDHAGFPFEYRFECTAYTSGTLVCELG